MILGSPKLSIDRTFAAVFKLSEEAVKLPPLSKLYRNPVALAQEWQRRISSSEVQSRAHLARQLGVSRAHVTQVLRLLRMAPGAKETVLALGDPIEGRVVGVHTLRSISKLSVEEQEHQIANRLLRSACVSPYHSSPLPSDQAVHQGAQL